VRLPERKTVKFAIALKNIHQICDKKKRHIIQDVIKSYSHYDEKTILKYFKDRKYIIEDYDFSKLEIYTLPQEAKWAATRINIDASFDQKAINSITDSGVRNILSSHLKKYNDANGKEHPEKAFSPEGLQDMNLHLKELNQGKAHKPILKVRKYEALGNKFNIGIRGSKDKKYVEADKGTNLFFAIYEDEEGNRTYDSIPFNIAVEHLKNLEDIAPQRKEDGSKLLFTLSPNDLVYLPEEGEHVDKNHLCKDRIYKMVSSSGKQSFFIPCNVATTIEDKKEFSPLNKMEKSINGVMIKRSCIKINVNRLGDIL
jgi:CRISPR-associated endonuclease Csn1